MNAFIYENLKVIWDYMHMNMELSHADCIVGFGNYNEAIPLRAAELYQAGFSSRILFTGGLGRNTSGRWATSEAERFADLAARAGVPKENIIIENKSTNTAENILFTRKKLEALHLPHAKIIGVHHPFMERRIYAALKVYWPEVDAIITSPQTTIEAYIRNSAIQGLDEKTAIEVIVGDFQRIDVYAKKGYQIPQYVPERVNESFRILVEAGYTGQLV